MHFKAATTTKVMCIFALQNKSHTTYISFIQEKSAKLFFFPEVLCRECKWQNRKHDKIVNCAHIS